MTELSEVTAPPPAGLSSARLRVISVNGRTVKVDIGGGMDIPCVDSCNPVPNQYVLVQVEGSSMIATAAIGGPGRQAALTVASSTTTTVTGILNGVSTVVSKAGAYTTTAGDVLPLMWAPDGSRVWALGPGGVPYVPPEGGGGGTGGGGGITTGTYSYAATDSGMYSGGRWFDGALGRNSTGAYFYGAGRFKGLQGRTITGFRFNVSGGSTAAVYGHPHASKPSGAPTLGYSAGSYSATGWKSLPIGLANYLISGSGTGGLVIVGAADGWPGTPQGTLQFDWRK